MNLQSASTQKKSNIVGDPFGGIMGPPSGSNNNFGGSASNNMGSMGMNNNMNSMGLGGNAFGNQQQQNADPFGNMANMGSSNQQRPPYGGGMNNNSNDPFGSLGIPQGNNNMFGNQQQASFNTFGGGNQTSSAMPQLQLSGTNDIFGGPSKTTVNNNDQDFFN
jgi:hypothetical protein